MTNPTHAPPSSTGPRARAPTCVLPSAYVALKAQAPAIPTVSDKGNVVQTPPCGAQWVSASRMSSRESSSGEHCPTHSALLQLMRGACALTGSTRGRMEERSGWARSTITYWW